MRSRPLIPALITGALLATISVSPTLAKKPDPGVDEERRLTAQEQAASDNKAAAAERYVASVDARPQGQLAPLVCVFSAGADPAADVAVDPACVTSTPQGFLAVEARDQIFSTYCGPAVGQVIANYSWAMPSGTNKYLQRQIAVWMHTDANQGTGAFALEAGLEVATARSPRRPAGWDWVVTNLVDSDRDGTTADQLHGYVRSNISGSRMPLALPVKPHDANSQYNLSSWPRPVLSPGHWITAYGWLGNFDGTDSARIYYTDSTQDEGGATGKFWDPTRILAALVGEHTRRIVW